MGDGPTGQDRFAIADLRFAIELKDTAQGPGIPGDNETVVKRLKRFGTFFAVFRSVARRSGQCLTCHAQKSEPFRDI